MTIAETAWVKMTLWRPRFVNLARALCIVLPRSFCRIILNPVSNVFRMPLTLQHAGTKFNFRDSCGLTVVGLLVKEMS
jgi:hypothetical protein